MKRMRDGTWDNETKKRVVKVCKTGAGEGKRRLMNKKGQERKSERKKGKR